MHAPDSALVGGKRNILLHIVRQQATLAKFLPAHGTGEHSPFVPTRFQFDQPGIPKAGFVKDHPYLLTRPMALRNSCVARSEEHTSELQSLMRISYAVFCLKKKQLI